MQQRMNQSYPIALPDTIINNYKFVPMLGQRTMEIKLLMFLSLVMVAPDVINSTTVCIYTEGRGNPLQIETRTFVLT